MMEDDPDYGYYCETGDDNVTPVKKNNNNNLTNTGKANSVISNDLSMIDVILIIKKFPTFFYTALPDIKWAFPDPD